MKSLLFILGILLACELSATENCVQLSKQYDDNSAKITELNRLLDDLKSRFNSAVQEDFQAQAEGVWKEIHRNTAIKAAHARHRLEAKIQEAEERSQRLSNRLCLRCEDFRSKHPNICPKQI